jgi:transposase
MNRDDTSRKVEQLEAELAQRDRLISGLQSQVAKLLDQVSKLLEADKKKKGRSKKGRKKRTPSSDDSKEEAPKPPARSGDDDPPEPKGTPRRGPLPDGLPRDVDEHPVDPGRVECCAAPLLEERAPIVQERRDLVRAHTRVRQTVLHRAECVCCGTLHTAETPPLAMPNGSMTASLLAYIVYGKCGLHLPLARIIEGLSAMGMPIPKSTMSNVMQHAADLLTPIVDRIVAALFSSDVLHLDGTGIDTLHPGESGKHRGQVAVCCNEQLTAYIYTKDKAGQHFVDFLGVGEADGYKGLLVADAANNMDRLYGQGITECGCWYHAWSKFDDATAGSPAAAAEGKAWIGTLTDIDAAAAKAGDTAPERLARRKRDAIPLLRGFYRWMCATQARFDPSEELWKAIQYCFNHWCALTRFMTDGRIPMTNNLAERELGPIGRGRKNWLFAGSDDGGTWLAKLHTVVRTCTRLAVAPDDYLEWVLPKLSDLPVNRGKGHLETLTPMAYAAAHAPT